MWACDHEGGMHFRIGVSMPQTESLPPAWVPVEGKPSGFGHVFTQVAVGGQGDTSVWALDNKRNVYVRKGICENMPIGTEWEQVEGKCRKHANKASYAPTPQKSVIFPLIGVEISKNCPGSFGSLMSYF